MSERREAMIASQIMARGVRDRRLIGALHQTPRELFLPPELAELAYEDRALPIEAGQTISQPYIVALMIEAARPDPGDCVLEIGLGSGYAAAVMSRLVREIFAIERYPELAGLARDRMAKLGIENVGIRTGDGSEGWASHAPFDAILVAAGAPVVPQPLRDQLAIGGRLVLPVGDADEQRLLRIERLGEEDFEEEDLGAVRFVPLVGTHGWTRAEPTSGGPTQ